MIQLILSRLREVYERNSNVTETRIDDAVRKTKALTAPQSMFLRGRLKNEKRLAKSARRQLTIAQQAVPPASERWKVPSFSAMLVLLLGMVFIGNDAGIGFAPLAGHVREALAALFGVLSVAAGAARYVSRTARRPGDRKSAHYIWVALTGIVVVATASLGMARATDLFNTMMSQLDGDAGWDRLLRCLTVVLIYVAVGAELATSWTVERLMALGGPTWRVLRLGQQLRRHEETIARLKAKLVELRQRPNRVAAELRERQAAQRREPIARETVTAVVPLHVGNGNGSHTQPARSGAAVPSGRRRRRGLRRTVISWLIIGLILGLAVLIYLLAAPAHAEAAEVLALIQDHTTSTSPQQFSRSQAFVEDTIRRLAENDRLIVFTIGAKSFEQEPLLDVTAPIVNPQWNRYGGQRRRWEKETIGRWRERNRALAPSAKCSDILGVLKRAELELRSIKSAAKHITLLSDGRHVSCERGGWNFEKFVGSQKAAVDAIVSRGLMPNLKGVIVDMLGVHMHDFTGAQWDELEMFWRAYFERAGAELRTYSPLFESTAK